MTRGDIRAIMLQLGRNMWGNWRAEGESLLPSERYSYDRVLFDETLWHRTTDYMVQRGMNMILLDLGEFVRYPRCPELAVEGSWSAERLNAEVRRLRSVGLEPIPKLNFSANHIAWLKEYGRMVSTEPYYRVCRDLIADASEIFEHPRFLHIGFDEEHGRSSRQHVVCRQGELWWHDFLLLVGACEDRGMRTWMWSDYGWHHPDFVKRCPKSVMQSNWYYDDDLQGFDPDDGKNHHKHILDLFLALDREGFEQIPCGSNWVSPVMKAAGLDNDASVGQLVDFCRARIRPDLLKGFLVTPWDDGLLTERDFRHTLKAIDLLADKCG